MSLEKVPLKKASLKKGSLKKASLEKALLKKAALEIWTRHLLNLAFEGQPAPQPASRSVDSVTIFEVLELRLQRIGLTEGDSPVASPMLLRKILIALMPTMLRLNASEVTVKERTAHLGVEAATGHLQAAAAKVRTKRDAAHVPTETNMDTEKKTSKKKSLQESMENAAAQLKHTSAALDAVEQYLKDLEPACGTGDSSYDDRKKARADEIEALREAQAILEDAFRAKFLQK